MGCGSAVSGPRRYAHVQFECDVNSQRNEGAAKGNVYAGSVHGGKNTQQVASTADTGQEVEAPAITFRSAGWVSSYAEQDHAHHLVANAGHDDGQRSATWQRDGAIDHSAAGAKKSDVSQTSGNVSRRSSASVVLDVDAKNAPPSDAAELDYGPCFGPLMLDRRTLNEFSADPRSYDIQRLLDCTSNSSVFLAKLRAGRPREIVVKRVNKKTSKQPMQMHVNEVRVLARLRHPCVVELLGVVDQPQQMDMLIEYCPRGSLITYLRAGFRKHILSILFDMACALLYMHGEWFVHLDVKPDNLLVANDVQAHSSELPLVGPSGIGKLCDFGTATRIGASRRLCGLVGTPGYRAPEVEAGLEFDAPLADVWSLGQVCKYVTQTSDVTLQGVDSMLQRVPSRRSSLKASMQALQMSSNVTD